MKRNILERIFSLLAFVLISVFSLNADKLSIPEFSVERNGSATASIDAQTSNGTMVEYMGFQFDLFLPENYSIETAVLNPLLTGFTLQQKDYGNGVYRFIAFSEGSPSTLAADIITLTIKADNNATGGTKSINIQKIIFSAPNGQEIKFENSVSSYVTNIPATGINLSPTDATLIVGQSLQLTTTISPSDVTDQTVTWKSDSESVASISTDGTVTAHSPGKATITASCGKVSATCTITVKGGSGSGDDGGITVKPGDGTNGGDDDGDGNWGQKTENGGYLNGNDLTLRVNQTATIEVELDPDLTLTPTLEWKLAEGGEQTVRLQASQNTLSADFTGLSIGETTYTISISGNTLVEGKVKVIAEKPIYTLRLDPESVSMAQNALPETISAVYTPEEVSVRTLTWTSSDPTVATVTEGEVKPLKQGVTTISARTTDGTDITATAEVNVTAPIDEDFEFDESVMGGVEGLTLYIGESRTIEPKAHEGYDLPKEIRWSSSDPQTVSVDQSGTVQGLAIGSATITASATINGKEINASCTVTVLPILVSGITLNTRTAELKATETLKLEATVTPDNATDKTLRWTTNAPSIASVNQEGMVTALMVGEANITARATDGSNVYASCTVKVVPTPATGITVKAEGSTTIKATETVTLTATVQPATATDKTVNWKSSDTGVATVTDSGVVTGVAVGTATITATNSAGQTAEIEIEVIPTLVDRIQLNRNTAQIKVMEGFRLTATILPATATDKSVSWTSSDPLTVAVDNEGNVTGMSLGTATITCRAEDGSGVTATCRITVTETSTESVSIKAEGPTTLKVTETVQLTATVLPATATDKSVSWQSDNSDIADVDYTGLVIAYGIGEATITATNSGGQTATIKITVVKTPVERIALDKTDLSLKRGESEQLTASVYPETATNKTVTWSSENPSVATVEQSGLVSALNAGKTRIAARSTDNGEIVAYCDITVIETEVTSISITANGPTTLKATETVQLTAIVLPETATDKTVTWSSADEAVATVNANGLVTALAVGQTEITASSASGVTASISITVDPTLVRSITLNRTTLTMKVGNESTLTATVLPETATNKNVLWTSSDEGVVKVDSKGAVTALKEGQATISCSSTDGTGITASCVVNIVDTDVETITINAEGPTTLKVTETVQLNVTILPETSTDKSVNWTSSDTEIASVDENGLVTANSEGTAVITATTANGLNDRITITVTQTLVTSVTLSEKNVTLLVDETYPLIPTILPGTATNKTLEWTSADTSVATITQDGIITAVAIGETIITATATDGSGVSAECLVSVIPTPTESVTIKYNGETTLYLNDEIQLTAEVLPANATDKSLQWSSSNETVATVNENGLVTAHSAGIAVISVACAGMFDRIEISVLPIERPDNGVEEIFDDWDSSQEGTPEEIIGIYTLDGKNLGKQLESLEPGVYIIRTTRRSLKVIK